MPYFRFDGLNVFYDEKGNGEPLLLLHGNTVSSNMFASEIAFWSSLFRVVYLDAPGHGQSDRLPFFRDDFWYYNSLAALELLKLLDIKKTKVIGTSGGAITGLNLAAAQPERIEKLIADSFFGLEIPLHEAKQIAYSRNEKNQSMMSKAFWNSMNGEGWEEIVRMDYELLVKIAENHLPIYFNPLSNIKAKVLFTAGRDDELISDIENRMNAAAELIPDCRCIYADEGKHPFMITEKEKFREIAMNFLFE